MPHYAIVIDNPDKHQQAALTRRPKAEYEREVQGAIARTRRDRVVSAAEADTFVQEQMQRYADRVERRRDVGELHTTADSECPDGHLNCRNCGDPAHKASCKAAGHCPLCGTRHGIAPDGYLAESGVSMVALSEPPTQDQEWDRARRQFVKRG